MKIIPSVLLASVVALALLPSCKKKSNSETTVQSTPTYQVGQPITPGNLPAGSYQGTMKSGNTYYLTGDPFIIPAGDTLLIQNNVHVCVGPNVTIIVKGVLISMGTQSDPNWITACGTNKVDIIGLNPNADPAYSMKWTGINCDTTCTLCELQWTHVEFCGAAFTQNEPCNGCPSGTNSWTIFFQNGKGQCIMTDSWMYGGVDDAVRFAGGRIYFARNTCEKLGLTGGDGLNAKHGTQGDMAYNLFIGMCTNSTKCSDKGSANVNVQCNINMYNNTYVDCGYRNSAYGPRGSDIDYEQGGRGLCYNNLIVNCRNGIRIGMGLNAIPAPDTTNTIVGYNYIYADSGHEVNQMYPIVAGTWTKPNAYSIPTQAQFGLPVHFYWPCCNPNSGNDLAYNDSSGANVLAMVNKPIFKNFPLPEPVTGFDLSAINSVETGVAVTSSPYDFHLMSGSPGIGAGFAGFQAFANIITPPAISNPHFAFTVTAPGIDMGCYQMNGSGNQH